MRYTVKDTSKPRSKEYEVDMSWDEFEELLKNNKNLQQVLKPILLGYRLGKIRLPEDYKSALKRMKKGNPGSTINDNW